MVHKTKMEKTGETRIYLKRTLGQQVRTSHNLRFYTDVFISNKQIDNIMLLTTKVKIHNMCQKNIQRIYLKKNSYPWGIIVFFENRRRYKLFVLYPSDRCNTLYYSYTFSRVFYVRRIFSDYIIRVIFWKYK